MRQVFRRSRTTTLTTHTLLQEYQACLSRIRSYLAGNRNKTTLSECERILQQASANVVAMQRIAQEAGDGMRLAETQQRLDRDIAPLQGEIQRQLNEMDRQSLFYEAPGAEASYDTAALIQSSDDLLLESQQILAETEYIGNNTLLQMGRQREQLESTNENIRAVVHIVQQARTILVSMSRRAFRNRACLWAMIVALVWANGYVLYRSYRKSHGSDENDEGDWREA